MGRAGSVAAIGTVDHNREVPERSLRRLVFGVAVGGVALSAFGIALMLRAGVGLPAAVTRMLSIQLPTTATGALLVHHRPRNRFGYVVFAAGAGNGLLIAMVGILESTTADSGLPHLIASGAFAYLWANAFIGTLGFILALAWFPDGHLPSRRWVVWVYVTSSLDALLLAVGYMTARTGELPPGTNGIHASVAGPLPAHHLHDVVVAVALPFGLILPVAAMVALVLKTIRGGPVIRQQGKLVLTVLVLSVIVQSAVPFSTDPWHGARGIAEFVVLLAPTALAAAWVTAIYRFRLWGVDAVLSKALVFGALSVAVSAAFLAVAFSAGLLASGSIAQAAVPVTLALAVTVAGRGVRSRAERRLRRFVYGERPTGYLVLADLGAELERHQARGGHVVVDAVARGLRAPWVILWLRVEAGPDLVLRPVAASGTDVPRATEATIELETALERADMAGSWREVDMTLANSVADVPGDAEAFAVLRTASEVVGLIVLGRRPGEPFGEDDFELLGLIARDAGLALRNERLEAELLQQLVQIDESRQRIVSAQDDERRRIERDLHDGAQADLVALVAELRSAADRQDKEVSLSVLADRAEAAMFNLQELARGIYPPVLTDRGLVPALRTHIARIPLDIRLVVEPSLTDSRAAPDVEAALYFVAVESLANVHKHAPTASAVVRLRSEATGMVTLEITDSGPGFESTPDRRGAGLQNMTDRLAAIGGRLTVRSRPGQGCSVRAHVSWNTTCQRPGADSLR